MPGHLGEDLARGDMSNLQSPQAMQLPTFGVGQASTPSFSRVIGIDPGASGAIALLVQGVLIAVHDMPTVTVERNKSQKRQVCPAGLSILIESLTGPYVTKAICEKVGAMPGQGVSSMFSFGRSVFVRHWRLDFSSSLPSQRMCALSVCRSLLWSDVMLAPPVLSEQRQRVHRPSPVQTGEPPAGIAP